MAVRVINLLLGSWLFVSAFLWRHSGAQLTNTWVVGLLCVLVSLFALRVQSARYLNTVLAIWLFISAFALPVVSNWTVWNNTLVALAIFLLSLIGSGIEEWGPRRPRTA